MKKSLHTNKGITIIEMLSYIALFGILLSVIYSIYYQFSRTLSAADGAMLRERAAFAVVRSLQQDIRLSKRVLDASGPFKASDGALILSVEDEGSTEHVIVYTFSKTNKALARYELPSREDPERVSFRMLGNDIRDFKFAVDKDTRDLINVTITVKRPRPAIMAHPPISFCAAMRNG